MKKYHLEINSLWSRPRFKFVVNATPEEVMQIFEKYFSTHNKMFGGYVNKEIAIIRLRKDKEKYWAPQLQIRTEWDEWDKKTYIRGLFGPRPAIWTFFMFLYATGIGVIFILGGFGLVNGTVNGDYGFLYLSIIGPFILLATYLATKAGQKIAKNHIRVLKAFVEMVLVCEHLIETEK